MDRRLAHAADEGDARGGQPLAPAAVGLVVGAVAAARQTVAVVDVVRRRERRLGRGGDRRRRRQSRVAGFVPGVDVLVKHAVEEGHLDALVDVRLAAVREGQGETSSVYIYE